MKTTNIGGIGRHFTHPDLYALGRRGPHHHHPRRGGHRRGGRLFDYGELRLFALALIAEQPRHGYDLIKAIEERLGGSYTPSPGVIYPTLAWLEDMGYTRVETADGNRKRHAITAEGEAFLAANRSAADDILARQAPADAARPGEPPAPILRAMENLKVAMRLRLRQGPVDPTTADTIAAALDAAAQAVERS